MAGPRPGSTRNCPHCKAIILESATVCPGCHHHLRFGPMAGQRTVAVKPALRVEGAIRHPGHQEPWEYSVVISIRNERDEEVARQVVGVGALLPSEQRTFRLSVDVISPAKEDAAAAATAAAAASAAAAAAATAGKNAPAQRPASATTLPSSGATMPSPKAPVITRPQPEADTAGQPSRSLQPPKALSPMKPAQHGTKRYY